MSPELDHIGIAVTNLQEVIDNMKEMFDCEPDFLELVPDQKVRIAGYNNKKTTIEYFEPTAPDSPVSKYLQTHKNGIHHIALRVENIEQKLAELKSKGVRLIDETPRAGANEKKIAFIHPKSCNGILIELCE